MSQRLWFLLLNFKLTFADVPGGVKGCVIQSEQIKVIQIWRRIQTLKRSFTREQMHAQSWLCHLHKCKVFKSSSVEVESTNWNMQTTDFVSIIYILTKGQNYSHNFFYTPSPLSVNLSTQQVFCPRISSGQRPRTIVSPNKLRGRDEKDRDGASWISTSEWGGF